MHTSRVVYRCVHQADSIMSVVGIEPERRTEKENKKQNHSFIPIQIFKVILQPMVTNNSVGPCPWICGLTDV